METVEVYRSALNAIDQGIAIAEIIRGPAGEVADLVFREVNEAFERHTGLSRDVVGRTVCGVFPTYDASRFDIHDRVAATGRPEQRDTYIADIDRHFRTRVVRIGGPGSPLVASIFEDITASKRTEQALTDTEERLSLVFDTLPIGVAIVDPNGVVLRLNDEMRRFLPTGVVPSRDPARARRYRAQAPDGTPVLPADFPVARALRGERVVPGLEVLYTPDEGPALWTRVAAAPLRDSAGKVTGAFMLVMDIDRLKRTEQQVRASEWRQRFLLQLSDALRPLADAVESQGTGCRLLGEFLAASRVFFVEYEAEAGYGAVVRDFAASGLPSLAGRYPFETFRTTYERLRRGSIWAVPDAATAADIADSERAFFVDQGITAWVDVPLVKGGRLQAVFCVVQAVPRAWTESEIQLIGETAERLWAAAERARAETHMRESEMRFRQFATASSDALWIRDAATLAMEYVNPSAGTVYGLNAEDLIGDVSRWAAIIVPEDRSTALACLENARRGDASRCEFRIMRPADGAFRWIRIAAFPLLDDQGKVQRIGGIAQDITEARQSAEHQRILLHELQHRVRNILAVIGSIAARTGERAGSVDEYAEIFGGRLMALARVQALLTRRANAGVTIRSIMQEEVEAQAGHEGQVESAGPDIVLSAKAAEVLSLAVHELTTNALKYGALSRTDGRIAIRWSLAEQRGVPWLHFDWIEKAAHMSMPENPVAPGFGTELIEDRLPYELGGRSKLVIGAGGACCHIEFPLEQGSSILETGGPRRIAICGGALDLREEADLSGQTILVLEDEFFMAFDVRRALETAGAAVLGPYGSVEAARSRLDQTLPSMAVVDINLDDRPCFEFARLLRNRNVPLVFVSGYDAAAIAPEFADVPLLQKPVELAQIVKAAARVAQPGGVPSLT